MQVLALVSILGISFASSSHLPAISWSHVSRSEDGIPFLKIEFPDGSVDHAKLSRFNPIPVGDDEDPASVDDCIFHGYLQNENNVYVTVTGGCPHADSFEVMMRSSKLQSHAYIVKQGVIEQVESVFGKASLRNDMPNKDEAHHLPEIEKYLQKQVSSRIAFPAEGFILRVKPFYDQLFKSRFGSGSINAMRKVLAMVQNFFYWPSLTTRITLQTAAYQEIPVSLSVSSTGLTTIRNYLTDTSIKSNVVFTNHNDAGGVVGIAWVGVVCYSNVYYRSNINDYYRTVTRTAEIVAHEIGHNLGMRHDFDGSVSKPRYDSKGRTCRNIGGIMDYYQSNVNKWSTCSVEDFQKYFDQNQPFCLPTGPSLKGMLRHFVSFCKSKGPGCSSACSTVGYSAGYVCLVKYYSYSFWCNCLFYNGYYF